MSKIIHPEILLQAYADGIFPMGVGSTDYEYRWYEPSYRGIIPLEKFRISKNNQRWIRNRPHECHFNCNFREVMKQCANRSNTWINQIILDSYYLLHDLGYAHSVEVYVEEELVGGLYGVAQNGVFWGESMFRTKPEMDKVAMYYCHRRLLERGFTLWDTQYYTLHLGTYGGIEIPQKAYLMLLQQAQSSALCQFYP